MAIRSFPLLLLLGLATAPALLQGQPFPDAHEQPTAGWCGPVFKLSQSYPATRPQALPLPWAGIRFDVEPERYMRAVLDYAFEGNDEVDWVVQKNPVRRWYHAPWMHWGEAGREFIHGLTRERHSRRQELSDRQMAEAHNWAVSVYNEIGGFTLGRVWADPSAPNPAAAHFAEGAVAIKLLFTDASPNDVPYLKDAPEWQAYVSPDSTPRALTLLRLLQVDFAVRDPRADFTTGWVFGTFQYDKDAGATSPWRRLTPVALTWGNDPEAFASPGGALQESWVNPAAPIVRYRRSMKREMGWGGRANGPVDNEKSSCLSCHATALYPATVPLTPDAAALEEDRRLWFQNLQSAQSLDPDAQPLDYSLQLSAGLANFYSWIDMVRNQGVAGTRPQLVHMPVALGQGRGNPQDLPFYRFGVSREEDEQKAIQLLPAHPPEKP